ncbi:hypothetical protein [Fusobacterium ulcerans]|uniref:hypothetical protein n=1 Tax=Fusobacterium ulcerans TaxID=861 RepID=UPI00267362C2|nr:hypothetical protein [Fusobacterium ulcerans]
MKKIISIAFMFLMVTVSSFAFFRTSVAPGIFEMNLDRSATEEIILVNNSNEPIRVKIYPGKDENIKDEEYLGEWLRIYPRTMTLEGNSERRIKFSIRAPKDKPDGEYRGLIYIEELPEVVEGQSTLTLAGRHGLTVYGTKGKVEYDIAVSNIKVVNNELTMNIKNNGKYSLRPEIKVNYLSAKGKKLGEIEEKTGRILKDRTAVKGITIVSSKDNIDFGRVLAGGTGAISPEVTLTLTGESGQNVVLNSTMTGDGIADLSFDDAAKITDGEKLPLTSGSATKTFKLKYKPTTAGALNTILTITASYDDTDDAWVATK